MMITSIMVAGQRALQTGQCPKHKAGYHLLVTVMMKTMIKTMMPLNQPGHADCEADESPTGETCHQGDQEYS